MSLEKHEVDLILTIIDLSVKYGVPLVKDTIDNLNKEQITQQDIDNLQIDTQWEDYFKD